METALWCVSGCVCMSGVCRKLSNRRMFSIVLFNFTFCCFCPAVKLRQISPSPVVHVGTYPSFHPTVIPPLSVSGELVRMRVSEPVQYFIERQKQLVPVFSFIIFKWQYVPCFSPAPDISHDVWCPASLPVSMGKITVLRFYSYILWLHFFSIC